MVIGVGNSARLADEIDLVVSAGGTRTFSGKFRC